MLRKGQACWPRLEGGQSTNRVLDQMLWVNEDTKTKGVFTAIFHPEGGRFNIKLYYCEHSPSSHLTTDKMEKEGLLSVTSDTRISVRVKKRRDDNRHIRNWSKIVNDIETNISRKLKEVLGHLLELSPWGLSDLRTFWPLLQMETPGHNELTHSYL